MLNVLVENYAADTVVVRDSNHSYSRDEILGRCQQLTDHLEQQQIQSIALHARNGIDWLVADIACVHAERCILPLPTFFSADQIEHALNRAQVDALVTDDETLLLNPLLRTAQNLGKLSGTDLVLLMLRNPAEADAPGATDPTLLPPNTGKITFTSGSTGQPKGVCLSHQQLQEQAAVLRDLVGLVAPRHLCLLPLTTLLENVAGIYAPLLVGGEIVIPAQEELGFEGSALKDHTKLLQVISKAEANSLILVPQLLMLLVAAAAQGWQCPASLRFIAVGGSKVPVDLLTKARALGLPVFEGYGLSECASVVSLNTESAQQLGSCGKPLPHVQISIEDGEVMIAGNAMLGYVNEPSSWNQGVIRSGDLGHLDEHGYLHIDGRRKNVLISSFGRNISPEWVESELLANPILADAVVLGDAMPYCVALLSSRNPAASSAEIRQWLDVVNSNLPDYAQIKAWHRLTAPLATQAGLLTDNGGPKREQIAARFAVEIDQLYQQSSRAQGSIGDAPSAAQFTTEEV